MSDGARLLDDDHDGVRLLDNPIPKWWILMFWATAIFSGFYFMYYQVGIGGSIQDELRAETAERADLLARKHKDVEASEEVLAEKMADASFMGSMKTVFDKKCATCHHSSGRGDSGPNLTDRYWLHGRELMDVYAAMRDGVCGQDMQPWQIELGPLRLLGVAAYVGTLRETNVAGGRGPEGTARDSSEAND